MNYSEVVGRVMSNALNASGLSQEGFAAKLCEEMERSGDHKMSRSSIWAWINATRMPTADVLLAAVKISKRPLEELSQGDIVLPKSDLEIRVAELETMPT